MVECGSVSSEKYGVCYMCFHVISHTSLPAMQYSNDKRSSQTLSSQQGSPYLTQTDSYGVSILRILEKNIILRRCHTIFAEHPFTKTTHALCHITFETLYCSEHTVFKKTHSTCISISCMDATVYVGLLFHISSLDVNVMMSTDVMFHTVMSCVDQREWGDDDPMTCVKNCVNF